MRLTILDKITARITLAAGAEDEKEMTIVHAVGMDESVWVGKAEDYLADANADHYEVVGDKSGFCYFAGSQSDCDDVAEQINDAMPFDTEQAAAMRPYKPRRKAGKRGERITPQERRKRQQYVKRNKLKLAMQRRKYYNRNKSQLQRRAEIRKRLGRPTVKRDDGYHYTYK